MNSPHHVGFAPSEISALVNRAVVEIHAGDAAFLWTLRSRAVSEPHFGLLDLVRLDERVEAHLDGLHIADVAGWQACHDNLAFAGAGEAFAAGVLAFSSKVPARLEALTATLPSTCVSGLVSALGWLAPEQVLAQLHELGRSHLARQRELSIAGHNVHRLDPGPVLGAAIADADDAVRLRALRAVGELGRRDLQGPVRDQLAGAEPSAKFWAAYSLVLTGDYSGVPHLLNAVREGSPFAHRALTIALPVLRIGETQAFLAELAAQPRSQALAIIGMGVAGDPASVPMLLDLLTQPALAQLAGESFSTITGADLAYLDLDTEPSEGGQEDLDDELSTYRSNLPWPAPELTAHWWSEHRGQFQSGTRYLSGLPITRASCVATLLRGKQRQRAAAAIELARLDPTAPLFNVSARGDRQQRQLARGAL